MTRARREPPALRLGPVGPRPLAAALTALAAFEAWNHETGLGPFAAGAALPLVLRGRAGSSTVGPFWLGIAGFFVPEGHRLQVAALGWSAHLLARRGAGSRPTRPPRRGCPRPGAGDLVASTV